MLPAVDRHEDRLVGKQASVMLGVQEIVSDPFEGPVVGHQDLAVSDPLPVPLLGICAKGVAGF